MWSVLTAVSGVARNFSQLIVARLGVGVGEATCSPASTSLIGDLFPTTQRARAVAIWMLGLPLGLGLANGAGGWILQNWGWRNAFYVAAVPGILCAIAALLHSRAAARDASRSTPSATRRRPGNPYLLVLSIPDDAVDHRVGRAAQLQHVRARRRSSRRSSSAFTSMSFLDAGWVAAVVYGFSGIVGLAGGGALADRLYRRARRRAPDRRHRRRSSSARR